MDQKLTKEEYAFEQTVIDWHLLKSFFFCRSGIPCIVKCHPQLSAVYASKWYAMTALLHYSIVSNHSVMSFCTLLFCWLVRNCSKWRLTVILIYDEIHTSAEVLCEVLDVISAFNAESLYYMNIALRRHAISVNLCICSGDCEDLTLSLILQGLAL